jgi:hypothetical protein
VGRSPGEFKLGRANHNQDLGGLRIQDSLHRHGDTGGNSSGVFSAIQALPILYRAGILLLRALPPNKKTAPSRMRLVRQSDTNGDSNPGFRTENWL